MWWCSVLILKALHPSNGMTHTAIPHTTSTTNSTNKLRQRVLVRAYQHYSPAATSYIHRSLFTHRRHTHCLQSFGVLLIYFVRLLTWMFWFFLCMLVFAAFVYFAHSERPRIVELSMKADIFYSVGAMNCAQLHSNRNFCTWRCFWIQLIFCDWRGIKCMGKEDICLPRKFYCRLA